MKKIAVKLLVALITIAVMIGPWLMMPSVVSADTSGPNNGSTFTNNSTVGTVDWSYCYNAQTQNDIYAYADLKNANEVTYYLKATGFGFSIPTGATIDGITVEVDRYVVFNGATDQPIFDNSIKLVKGGVISGEEKSTGLVWPNTTDSDTYVTYGGTNDTWGLSWDYSDINSVNFGVAISAINSEWNRDRTANIDHIRITVTYTLGGIVLAPDSATNNVGSPHTVYATISGDTGGTNVTFNVTYGPNAGDTGTGSTNGSGVANWTYTSNGVAGTDTIVAKYHNTTAWVFSNNVTKTWVDYSLVKVQLAMILDGSGSIDPNFGNMTAGLAAAVNNSACIPHDGSVELTVVQFAEDARLEVGPVIINGANAADVADDIKKISQGVGGGTHTCICCGICLAANTLYDSPCFDPSVKQVLNLVTGGEPNRCCNCSYSYNSQQQNATNNSAVSGAFVNPEYAYLDDGFWASATNGQVQDYYGYNFSIPDGEMVRGIEVGISGWGRYANDARFDVELSWDGGTSWTSTGYGTEIFTTGFPVLFETGGATDLWGHNWTPYEVNNNLRVRVTAVANMGPGSGTHWVNLEWVPVTVYYGDPTSCSCSDYTGSDSGDAEACAEAARTYALTTLNMTDDQDEFNAEFTYGSNCSASDWLRNHIVWPEPGYYWDPPTHGYNGTGWVYLVPNATASYDAFCEKFQTLFPPPNNPPNAPSNPSPLNHVTDVSIDADLSWTGGDPDVGDNVTYDVYFGTNSTPPQVSNNQTGTTYDPGTLSYNTTYYWKVVATDNHSASTAGPLWDFTTCLPSLMEGDATLDRHVTMVDALFIAQHRAKLITLNADQLICSDTTDDGVVDMIDALHIAQWRVDSDGTGGVLFKPLWESPADDDMLPPQK